MIAEIKNYVALIDANGPYEPSQQAIVVGKGE